MGWNNGSALMDDVIEAVRETGLAHGARYRLYMKLIPAFQDYDWDTETECMGSDDAFDQALQELHPAWFEEDDDEIEDDGNGV